MNLEWPASATFWRNQRVLVTGRRGVLGPTRAVAKLREYGATQMLGQQVVQDADGRLESGGLTEPFILHVGGDELGPPRCLGDEATPGQTNGSCQRDRSGGDRVMIQRLANGELRARLLPVFKRHQIVRAILFGSRARGEASRRSDVDLILVQRTDRRFLDRYDRLLYELNLALPDVAVDALIYTPEELEQMARRRFMATALREGQVIYESE